VVTFDIWPDGSWWEAEHFIKTIAPELVQVRVCQWCNALGVCWRCGCASLELYCCVNGLWCVVTKMGSDGSWREAQHFIKLGTGASAGRRMSLVQCAFMCVGVLILY
jgi:hypothetical protein